jgi:type IV pilus assembly protein PilY1
MLQATNGRLWAGGTGEILRTADAATPTDLSVQIAASSDDAEQTGTTMNLTQNDLDFFQGRWVGMRFDNITIAQGATINTAVVEFTAQENASGTSGEMEIYCEDVDDATTFTSGASDISNRTLTTANASWENAETWSNGNTYDSADFTSAVQEVVNRASWASGNAINVIFKPITSTNDRDADSYDGSAGDAPTIKINYSAPLAADETWEQVHSRLAMCAHWRR